MAKRQKEQKQPETKKPFTIVGSEEASGRESPGLIRTMASALMSRMNLANLGGLRFGSERDFYGVFGYKTRLTEQDFLAKYIRQDIASRIIDAPPGATWSNPPKLTGPAGIQNQWEKLVKATKLNNIMYRADRLSRANYYSVILLGFNDTGMIERPVNAEKITELLYARAYGSISVKEIELDKDPMSPRYGLPAMYSINIDTPSTRTISSGGNLTKADNTVKVHHSRVIHVVENPLQDDIVGIPIIEKTFNMLDDLLKVTGGASEMFWLAANRGIQANIDKEMDLSEEDAADLSDEIEEWQHQLRRFVRTRGVELNVLESDSPNPKEPFDVLIALISGTTGIPRRILLGSEAGQLASEQDRANWAERIDERRTLFAEPFILDPLIEILQLVGILSEGDVEYDWPSAFILSPLENSMTMAQTARAIGNISRQTGNKQPMQLTSVEEGRNIINLEGDLPESEVFEQEPEPAPRVLPGNVDDDDDDGASKEET
jgi:hypothetical protein